jgi:hypothetical protein
MSVLQTVERLGIDGKVQGDELIAACPAHKDRTGKADAHPSRMVGFRSVEHQPDQGSIPVLLLWLEGIAEIPGRVPDRGEVSAGAGYFAVDLDPCWRRDDRHHLLSAGRRGLDAAVWNCFSCGWKGSLRPVPDLDPGADRHHLLSAGKRPEGLLPAP